MKQSPSEANIHTVPHASIHLAWNPRFITAFQNSPNEVHTLFFFFKSHLSLSLHLSPGHSSSNLFRFPDEKGCKAFLPCMLHAPPFLSLLILSSFCWVKRTNYEAPQYTSMVFSNLLLLPPRSKYSQYLVLTHHILVLIPVNL
jgi:hypothetical protein